MKAKIYVTDNYGFMREREIFSTSETVPGAVHLKIGENAVHKDFLGFGVAVTGSSCYLLRKMDGKKREELLRNLYGTVNTEAVTPPGPEMTNSKETEAISSAASPFGLGLSLGRVSVGSGDYSAEIYSYEDEEGNFSIEKDRAYVLPTLHEILRIAPNTEFFSASWSPPARMKTGNSLCGGYMREKFIGEYVDYYCNFLDAYEKEGIRIFAITPQNEPETEQDGKMPACIWEPDVEAKFILQMYRKLREKRKDTQIWIYDYCFLGWRRVAWQLEEYPELLNCIGGAAFHYYHGGSDLVENLRERYPELSFHFTEGGPRLFDGYATDWCKWGSTISRALNHGCKSFTGWNLLLDETGGPNVGPFFCGGLVTENSQTGELTYSGQYRALSHFSRFIRRGAKFYSSVAVGEDRSTFLYRPGFVELETCVAENPDGEWIVQIVNPGEEKKQICFTAKGHHWYIEVLPNSLNTVVLK